VGGRLSSITTRASALERLTSGNRLIRYLLESLIGVAVKNPGIVNLGIQSHVNGTAVGGDIIYRGRERVQRGRSINVGAVGRTTDNEPISRSASRAPLERNARRSEGGARHGK
jgi:hypothetical protein